METIVCGRWNKHSSQNPETRELWSTRNRYDSGKATYEELRSAQNSVTALLLRELEARGVSIIGDGSIRWDSAFDITRKISGCGKFSQLTRIPKTNHFHRQPFVTHSLSLPENILLEDLTFAKAHTSKPIVVSLAGPYSLARQTQNLDTLGLEYLGRAYASVLNQEIRTLLGNGAAFVRIEESQILDHPEDFALFRKLTSLLVENIDESRLALATWFGGVGAFNDYFGLPFGIFFLDFVDATENIKTLRFFPAQKRLVAGIFDGRHSHDKSNELPRNTFCEITKFVPKERLYLSTNTDLHFLPWDKSLEKVDRLTVFAEEYGKLDVPKLPRRVFQLAYGISAQPQEKIPEETPVLPLRTICDIPFPTSAVGSYPQNEEIRRARLSLRKGKLDPASYRELVEEHTRCWMNFQEEIGINVPVGGEFLREDMAVYFGVPLGGKLCDFVPSYENRRYHPVEYDREITPLQKSILLPDFLFLQKLTKRPIKETITGPATLADWALIKNEGYYLDRRAFRLDLARALRKEAFELANGGVKILQVDEPALTTKMENFEMDWEAISEMINGLESKLYLVLHICYSDMEALDKAFPHILKLPFHQIHMEMANRNYGLLGLIEKHGFGGKDIGLGVIDVHTNRIETTDEIVEGVQRVMPHFKNHGQIWITPDCGLKERTDEVAKEKLRVMAKAAEICRNRFS